MDAQVIENMFRTDEGVYAFARWNRPISPVIFGVDEASLPVLKGAIEAVAALTGVGTQETDPELGSNFMMFFIRNWDELTATPDLDRLVPDLGPLVDRLQRADAAQYRFFRFDAAGGIRAAFLFVRMTGAMADLPAETLALTQAVQAALTWGPGAFAETSPLALHPETGAVVLRPEVADLIRAAYDPVMPVAAGDAAHALRLAARVGVFHSADDFR
jgi:hypothetical protein